MKKRMSEDASTTGPAPKSWLDRLSQMISGEVRSREELIEELRTAHSNGLLSADTLGMIEGAIAVADQQVSDVMIPRSQIVAVPLKSSLNQVLAIVTESGHSRFPVTRESRDDVVGILLAKDILKCLAPGATEFCLEKLVRSASKIPESKRLNVLLREFRASRNHMAIVVDEFGGVSGLITIEDVLEEIVGEIDDEHDDEDDITDMIKALPDGRFLVNALTPIEEFNERFDTEFADEDYDTIGGLVLAKIGRLPIVGEEAQLGDMHFKVSKADRRRVHQFSVHLDGR